MSDLFAIGLAMGLGTCALLMAWTGRQRTESTAGVSIDGHERMAGPPHWYASSKALAVAALAALLAPIAVAQFAAPSSVPGGVTHVAAAAKAIGESEVAQLESYLTKVGGGKPAVIAAGRDLQPLQSQMPPSAASELPDVDTMIGRLAARLEHAPDDVEGWRTLGWSYLNTDRASAAVAAYERAAKLAPDRGDITQALADARAAAAATPATR